MDSVISFFTSKGGIFAAIVAVLGLVALIVGLVRPVLQGRREAVQARPDLQLSNVSVEPPPPHSEAEQATFEILNTGGGKAVVGDLLLLWTCWDGRGADFSSNSRMCSGFTVLVAQALAG